MGIAAAQISRYESDKNFPRPHIVAKLATALEVPAEWLSGDSGELPVQNVKVEDRPHGGGVISFTPSPELAARMEQIAQDMGISANELLGRIVEQWVTGRADLVSAEEMDKIDAIMKRLARLEKASGIEPSTTQPDS